MNLDVLPAWLRHLAIAFGATFLAFVLNAVVAANGVTEVAWLDTAVGGVNAAAVVTATAALVLWITPATRQYGAGSNKDAKDEVGDH